MHMAIGKTYGVKRTVWIEVRSENKSWYYDNSLLIYFHFPLPLRASCMAGVVSNATQLSKLICTNSARRPQQENGSWHKRGIGLKASFRMWNGWNATKRVKRYEAGAEIYYNSVYYFRHAYYEVQQSVYTKSWWSKWGDHLKGQHC